MRLPIAIVAALLAAGCSHPGAPSAQQHPQGLQVEGLHVDQSANPAFRVLGEVRNDGPGAYAFPRLEITLYAANNSTIGRIASLADMNILAAGHRSAFEARWPTRSDVARYEVSIVSTYSSNRTVESTMLLLGEPTQENLTHNLTRLTVALVNNATQAAHGVALHAIAYGSDGAVVGFARSAVDPDPLPPGARVDATILVASDGAPARVSLDADARSFG